MQDCMEYCDHAEYNNEAVDGFILQAPVSDREAIRSTTNKEVLDASLETAAEMIKAGSEKDCVPRDKMTPAFNTPITAYRWHSLAAVG